MSEYVPGDRYPASIFNVAVAAGDVPFVSRFVLKVLLPEVICIKPVGDNVTVGSGCTDTATVTLPSEATLDPLGCIVSVALGGAVIKVRSCAAAAPPRPVGQLIVFPQGIPPYILGGYKEVSVEGGITVVDTKS